MWLKLLMILFIFGAFLSGCSSSVKSYSAYQQPYNTNISFEQLLELANKGNAEAQYHLGWMYANGKGVTEDEQAAIYWYKKAAEQGHGIARKNLAEIQEWNKTTVNNQKIFEQEANRINSRKKQLETNLQQALNAIKSKPGYRKTYNIIMNTWDQASREKFGEDTEMVSLLNMDVESGLYDELLPLFEKAKSYGGKTSLDYYSEAAKIFYQKITSNKTDLDNILERAQRGDVLSQMTLAWRYENGKEGVSRDKQTAIYWYQQAANRGNFEAKEALTRLNSTSSDQPTQATLNDSGKPNKPTRKLNTKMYTGVFTE